jgi:hypothetical protein
VAQNPNTPTEALFSLAGEFPNEVIANPAFPLLLLSEPDPASFPEGAIIDLLQAATLPDELVYLSANHPSPGARAALAARPDAPPEVLRRLLDDRYYSVSSVAARNPNAPPDALAEALGSLYDETRRAAAENPRTPDQAKQLFLRAGTDPDWVSFAAPDLTLSGEELAHLSTQGRWARCLVARHPNTPGALLESMTGPEVPFEVRESLLENPALSGVLLAKLCEHHERERGMSRIIARHPRTPPEVLAKLAQRNDALTRWRVSNHPATPAETLALLADDPGNHRWLARNPHTPAEVLARLSGEVDPDTQRALAKNPSAPEALCQRLAAQSDEHTRAALAQRERLSPSLLESLCADAAELVREALAQNRRLSWGEIGALAQDPSPRVRAALLARGDLPEEILAQLRRDKEQRVRNRATLRNAARETVPNPEG